MKKLVFSKIGVFFTLLFTVACNNTDPGTTESYLDIKNYWSKNPEIGQQYILEVHERKINDTVIDIYYYLLDENRNKEIEVPTGFRMFFSSYSNLLINDYYQNSGSYYLIDKLDSDASSSMSEIYVFARVAYENEDDTKSLVFYSLSKGFLAKYSVAWDRIFIRKSVGSSFYKTFLEVYEKLQNDPSYYALPKP